MVPSVRVLARIGDRELALEVTREGVTYHVTIEGRSAPAVVEGHGPLRAVTLDDQTVETAAWRSAAAGDAARGESTWDVVAGGRLHAVRLIDPLRSGGRGEDAGHDGGPIEVRAVMPGKIVALLAAEGDSVEAGQGLLVVEAMKMENEITAPRAGRMSSIKVKQGEAVESGALLLILE
jgi:biotin carboxyl carrier protein